MSKTAIVRAGFEIAAPAWIIYSASADTDFDRHFAVALAVEAASPAILILPSLSFGAGVPIRVRPDVSVGIRILGGFHFPYVGLAVSYDIYSTGLPGEVSVLARIGL